MGPVSLAQGVGFSQDAAQQDSDVQEQTPMAMRLLGFG